jgi:hypothetical protein
MGLSCSLTVGISFILQSLAYYVAYPIGIARRSIQKGFWLLSSVKLHSHLRS